MKRDLAQGAFSLAVPLPRLMVVLGFFVVMLVAIMVRALWLITAERDFLQRQGELRYERVVEVAAARGRILDRNGTILADSRPMFSVWVDPQRFDERANAEEIGKLAAALGFGLNELEERIRKGGRRFAYLKRFIEQEQAERIAALKVPGVGLLQEPRRTYPQRELVANIIGLTDPDGRGIEGLERGLEHELAGRSGKRLIVQDRQGNPVREVEWLQTPEPGADVLLAIDLRIQAVAMRALRAAVEEHRAQAASAVVLDAQTGEILALANWPTFDPERRERIDWNMVRNRALTDAYEPGSVMKPILVALALERGIVRPDTRIDTQGGAITISGHRITDVHASQRPLTVTEVVQKSSNVGVVKIAQMLSASDVLAHYRRFGFGEKPKLPLDGLSGGRLFAAKTIKPIELATMAYGHGMAATLVQVASAYQAIANGGCRQEPSLLKLHAPLRCDGAKQVISPKTAQEIQRMLQSVTEEGGTGTRARTAGYTTAGKTGTARKLENGQYVAKYLASFVGYAPATRPRVVVAVLVDEPQGKIYYGGAVAAPLFAEIVAEALPLLGVLPDAKLQQTARTGEKAG